ncbi:hypothetical protein D1632_00225 [Chryseobacterium nematophagum]|uniref:Uncharacterized protein n=1 Tax=Chryseobacterium nematophagum TaxID=2305228 RepID=A0A3M7LI68_9FLAO|nr:hypothetical protein [Chryseobacterium nematophagum]RMZ61272.1 hypothetical protein D1632_00225 [Chryseobacterium nematophagum]
MNHYGKYLPWAESPIKYKSDEIERLMWRERELKRDLLKVQNEIRTVEFEFSKLTNSDWSNDEIEEVKKV